MRKWVFRILALILFIAFFNWIDGLDISLKLAGLFSNPKAQLIIKTLIPNIKGASFAVGGFLLAQWKDIVDLFIKREKETPALSIEVQYTSSIRKSDPRDATDVIKIGKDCNEGIYICAILKNQCDMDLMSILVQDQKLKCSSLKKGDTYTIHLKIPHTAKKLKMKVQVQNSYNIFYRSIYLLHFNQKTRETLISTKKKFKECY